MIYYWRQSLNNSNDCEKVYASTNWNVDKIDFHVMRTYSDAEINFVSAYEDSILQHSFMTLCRLKDGVYGDTNTDKSAARI
jgi:hypothetical protein